MPRYDLTLNKDKKPYEPKAKRVIPTCSMCKLTGNHYIILDHAGRCWNCNPTLSKRRHIYTADDVRKADKARKAKSDTPLE